jgi:hypothetical protein
LRADKAVNEFSVLEDEHGRNTLNLELGSRVRVFINIQLGHAVTTIRLGSKLIHNRANHAAGSAPGRPTIEQDSPALALQHIPLKSGVSHHQRLCFLSSTFCLAHIEGRTTLATFRNLFCYIARVNAIPSPTVATSHYKHFVLRLKATKIGVIIPEKFCKTVARKTFGVR